MPIKNWRQALTAIRGNRSFSTNFILLLSLQGLGILYSLANGKLIALYASPDAFGSFTVAFAAVSLLFSILYRPVIQGYKYFTSSLKDWGSQPDFAQIFVLLTLLACLILGIYFAISSQEGGWQLYFLALNYLAWNTLFTLLVERKILSGRFGRYGLLQSLNYLSGVTTTLVLVFSYGYLSSLDLWWVNNLSFMVPVLLYVFIYKMQGRYTLPDFRQWVWKNRDFIAVLKKYTLPLYSLAIFGWLLEQCDKILLGYMIDKAAAGYYSMGYNLGVKILLLATPFTYLLQPLAYKPMQGTEEWRTYFQKNRLYKGLFAAAMAVIILVALVFRDFIGQLLLSDKYKPSFILIPQIMLSALFTGLVYLNEVLFYAQAKTQLVLTNKILAALLNILLNILLIPLWGIQGSACSMVICTLVQWIYTEYQAQNLKKQISQPAL